MHRIQYEFATETKMSIRMGMTRRMLSVCVCELALLRRAAHFVLFANFMPQIPQELQQQPAE